VKVIALAKGFYGGGPIAKGTTFDVPEGAKASWFVPVAAHKAAPEKVAEKPKADTLSKLGKEKPQSFNAVHVKSDLA